MDKAKQDLANSNLIEGALQVGQTAPDFSLPNQNGEQRQLSDLLKNGAVVISFYRGGWCPYCNLELKALQDILSDIKAAGANLIAITPETPDHSLSTAQKNALAFDVLSDQGNAVANQFGLKFSIAEELVQLYIKRGLDLQKAHGDSSFTLPLPATYVVAQDGKVIYQFVDTDHTRRAEPENILKILNN